MVFHGCLFFRLCSKWCFWIWFSAILYVMMSFVWMYSPCSWIRSSTSLFLAFTVPVSILYFKQHFLWGEGGSYFQQLSSHIFWKLTFAILCSRGEIISTREWEDWMEELSELRRKIVSEEPFMFLISIIMWAASFSHFTRETKNHIFTHSLCIFGWYL